MKRYFTISFIILTGFIFNSCTSSVRFSSEYIPIQVENQIIGKTSKLNKQVNCDISQIHFDSEYDKINLLLEEAKSWLGTPYSYAGTTKKGADCSGFTQSIYSTLQISIPRTAQQQYNFTSRIKKKNRQAGDLVFFVKRKKITHVGVYAGKGMFFHASSSKGVVYEKLDKSAYRNIAGYGRIPQFISNK